MPIRPEHRQYYGRDFHNVRLALIEEAGGQICGKCGIELAQGINAAHLNHDRRDLDAIALRCPSCHARHDAPHRIAIMRRRRSKRAGQLWLLPELEWAPFADWEIPARLADFLRQLPLFPSL